MRGLLLDFGFVCLKSPFELIDRYEQRVGLTPGTLPWRGPFDLERDALWADVAAGRSTEREYWRVRAAELQGITGAAVGLRDLTAAIFEGDEDDVMRPETRALVRDATAEGLRVGILSNDLRTFHGEDWAARMSLLREVAFVLDASADHVPPKPDPRAYQAAWEKLGLPSADVLFVDDLDANVQGAIAVGLPAIRFDVTDVAASSARVRSRLGLDRRR